MNKELLSNKPLYDYSIEYDITNLPEEMQIMIKQLEELDKDHDWFNYDIIFDQLEVTSRCYLRNYDITENDYKMILRKYGWFNE